MDWTDYFGQKLREQEEAAANEERQRRIRQEHFEKIVAAAYRHIRDACATNRINSSYREDSGHNFWIGDYRFRMHLVGQFDSMKVATYAYLERPAEQKSLDTVKNDAGDSEILALSADDICRYLLDHYLILRGSRR